MYFQESSGALVEKHTLNNVVYANTVFFSSLTPQFSVFLVIPITLSQPTSVCWKLLKE